MKTSMNFVNQSCMIVNQGSPVKTNPVKRFLDLLLVILAFQIPRLNNDGDTRLFDMKILDELQTRVEVKYDSTKIFTAHDVL